MAAPTITALNPIAGHSGGRTYVEITGSGYRVPTPQTANDGITPAPPTSVAVTFGGTAAREVVWVNGGRLFAVTPSHDAGTVDVVVTNLDDDGDPIPGESVTLASGYSFQAPDLTVEGDLARIVRVLILELRRQITPNVSWPTHTDYDTDTGDMLNTTEVAAMPALILNEMALPENKFFSIREPVEVEASAPIDGDDPESFVAIAPPVTVDLVISVVGVSDSSIELLNLAQAVRRFFRKNPYLVVDRDPADAAKGQVQYEMDWGESDGKVSAGANKDNVRSFVGAIVVRGVDIETFAGLPLGGPGNDGSTPHESTVDYGPTTDTVVLEPTVQKAIS